MEEGHVGGLANEKTLLKSPCDIIIADMAMIIFIGYINAYIKLFKRDQNGSGNFALVLYQIR